MSILNNPLFISWIGIITCTIIGSLLFVYRPYYYVIAYAILCIFIGSVGMSNTTPTTWNMVLYAIYTTCIISTIIYFNYQLKPTIYILITAILIFIISNRVIHSITSYTHKTLPNNTIQSFNAVMVLLLFGLVTAIIQIVIHPPSKHTMDSIYTYLTIIAIIIILAISGILFLYTKIHHVYVLIFLSLGALLILATWYMLKIQPYIKSIFASDTDTYSFLVNKPTAISPGQIVVTSEQFNRIRTTQYKYSIQFDVLILPGIGTNIRMPIMHIDNNIQVCYNNDTGILSVWGIKEGHSDFELLHGNYIIPLQTWTSILINIIDGKVDIAINNKLKMSTNIILKNQFQNGNIQIGDDTPSWIKGYIQNIRISNTIYLI